MVSIVPSIGDVPAFLMSQETFPSLTGAEYMTPSAPAIPARPFESVATSEAAAKNFIGSPPGCGRRRCALGLKLTELCFRHFGGGTYTAGAPRVKDFARSCRARVR